MIFLHIWSILCCTGLVLLLTRDDRDIFIKEFIGLINSHRSIFYIAITLLLLYIAIPFTISDSINLWRNKNK